MTDIFNELILDEVKLRSYMNSIGSVTNTETKNRRDFINWCEIADAILKGEFQKKFQEKLRYTYDIDITNSEMEFLTDKAESSKPAYIIKTKVGELLKYNISPELQTFDTEKIKEKDLAIVNAYIKQVINRSSFTNQQRRVFDSALSYGVGITKTEFNINPQNMYKLHNGISIKHISPKNIIVDDNLNEFDDMSYCGDFINVSGYTEYQKFTTREKEVYDYCFKNKIQINQTNRFFFKFFKKRCDFRNFVKIQDKTILTNFYIKEFYNGKLHVIEIKFLGGTPFSFKRLNQSSFPYQKKNYAEEDGNFYGFSLLYLLFDSYILLLRAKDSIQQSLLYATNPCYSIDVNSIGISIEETLTFLNIPGAGIPVSSQDAIRRIERSNLTTEMMNAYSLADTELERVSGLTPFNTGASSGSILTTGGITQMLDASNTAQQTDIPMIEDFTKNVTYSIIELLHGNKKEIKASISEDNGFKEKTLNITEDIVNNINIVLNVKSTRVNQQNAIVALSQILQIIPPDETGVTDELRDTLVVAICDLLPTDDITREKIKKDTQEATENVRKKRDEDKVKETAQKTQQAMALAGGIANAVQISDYMK